MFKTKTETYMWCILEADRKCIFHFGRKRKCRRKLNSIYDRKQNENENGHSFSAEKRKESHLYNAPPIPRPDLPCRWSLLTGFHFPHVQCLYIFLALLKITFQPVNSLLSWFIATEWKQCSTIYALCFTGVCFGFITLRAKLRRSVL